MEGGTARKEEVIAISTCHSSERKSRSTSEAVASGTTGADVGVIEGEVGAKRKRSRRKRRRVKKRRNRKRNAISRGVAISGESLDQAVKRVLLDPKDDCPSQGQGLQSGGTSTTAAEGGGGIVSGPNFTPVTPARKVREQASGSTVCPDTCTDEQSTKKRMATDWSGGATASGPRKRPRVNFKEIRDTEIPSPRDIPFNYVVCRRMKRPLPSGAEGKPTQEVEGRFQVQNRQTEERLERMFESESPTRGLPIEAVNYSTGYARSPGLGPAEAPLSPLSTTFTSETLKSDFSVEGQDIAQSSRDPPVRDYQKLDTALEKAIGEASGPRAHQLHRRKPQARRTGASPPPAKPAKTSPYFPVPPSKPRKKSSRTSPYFPPDVKIKAGSSAISWPRDDDPCYGLVQEELKNNPFQLLIACMFLNVTSSVKAVSKLRKFLQRYPTPEILAQANVRDITDMIKTLGLQNKRAKTLIAFGKEWLLNPPTKYVGARKQGYPRRETLGSLSFPGVDPIAKDERFEVAHLPGVGPYALDAWRIFCLDDLRGNHNGEEWTRVTPVDKELRGLLRWRWWTRKGVRWIEEGDSEAFKKFWVMKCDGSVCGNMCKLGFPTQRCPRGQLDMVDPGSYRSHIPPEPVIVGGRKELMREQIDTPDPAVISDYIPFGHATAEIKKGSDKLSDGGESANPASRPTATTATTSVARRGLVGTDSRGIAMENQALSSQKNKPRPKEEGIITQGNHHPRRGKDSNNSTDGISRSLTRSAVCYTLDPSEIHEVHPDASAPKRPLRWIPLESFPAPPPPLANMRQKTQQGRGGGEISRKRNLL